MKHEIIIIGAGGHAKVICDAIIAQGKYEIKGFVDAAVPVGEIVMYNYKVISSENKLEELADNTCYFVVAIGNNKIRESLFHKALQFLKPAIIIHPSAIIAKSVEIKTGSVCLAGSIINSNCTVEENTIVNSGVVIDHDCKIGKHVHLSIGTMVGSNSVVSDGFMTTIGARIESFSKI